MTRLVYYLRNEIFMNKSHIMKKENLEQLLKQKAKANKLSLKSKIHLDF